MVSLIVDLDTVVEEERREVTIEGSGGEELLLGWLREILFLMERGGMVFSVFRIDEDNFSYAKVNGYRFRGTLGGERVDPTRHDICSEIKAVTRHGLFLERREPLWEARILFDV